MSLEDVPWVTLSWYMLAAESGWCLKHEKARGELDKADATLPKASLMKPFNTDVFYHLGIVKTEHGQAGEAAAALEKPLP